MLKKGAKAAAQLNANAMGLPPLMQDHSSSGDFSTEFGMNGSRVQLPAEGDSGNGGRAEENPVVLGEETRSSPLK